MKKRKPRAWVNRPCVECGVARIVRKDSTSTRCRSCASHYGGIAPKPKPGPTPRESIAARFWRKVAITPGCWIWTGSRNKNGYGKISRSKWEGSGFAHRVGWELQVGQIPQGLFVLHGCDNPPCVRAAPGHLFLGTQLDNIEDMRSKGRDRHWGNHPHDDRGRRS